MTDIEENVHSNETAGSVPSPSNEVADEGQEAPDVNEEQADADDEDAYQAAPLSAFEHYALKVDPKQNDRATEIKLFSCQRPHMRAFHTAWISFFMAFMLWFTVSPLLGEIQFSLKLTKREIWNSIICSDAIAVLLRLIVAPLCSTYGPRLPMALFLCLSSIAVACTGLIKSAAGLAVLRFFSGAAGTTFVPAMYWGTRMFTKETAGTVNGIVAGWGNSGGAFAQVLMGSALFPLFTKIYDGDRERSWRTICVIPAMVSFVCGCCIPFISDDAPMGNYKEMKKNSTMDLSFYSAKWTHSGWTDRNAWLLGLQYACCFGVELVMNNAASLYFSYKFGMGTEAAAATASAFGWMNLFARFAGGKISDKLNLSHGMRGRLWVQTVCLLLEGAIIVAFAYADSLAGSIITMCIFSIFVQAAEGAIYGVVPYVSRTGIVGSAAGIVGSGGNIGGMAFGFVFRSLSFKSAFIVMGSIVMSSSFLSLFIHIHGHSGLVMGKDSVVTVAARERYLSRRRRGN